ncbi:hypothetical protein THAOC_14274, partial [Thalassiosira oceanica]
TKDRLPAVIRHASAWRRWRGGPLAAYDLHRDSIAHHRRDDGSRSQQQCPRGRQQQQCPRGRPPRPGRPPPPARGSPSVHDAVMDSYYKHRKGGAVVHCGKRFMLAVEFNAPARAGRAIEADMVYVDKNPQARAVVQARRCGSAKELGAAFLRGEEFEYMEVDEAAFFDLLKRYKRGSKTEGLIDMGSGLRMYNVTLIR